MPTYSLLAFPRQQSREVYMQHKLITYEEACTLISDYGAEEIFSSGWSQTFRAEADNRTIYIQLNGANESLLIEEEQRAA
ncbi:hypothetical protein NCCP436_33870 [Pseudomonas sp. NCCP-436]|nr:hypothetical protein NCCP436_33870 [Pseudomonas sp. NCCP-436]